MYDLICSKKQLKQVIHCVNVNLSVHMVYTILSYGAVNIAYSFSAIAIFFVNSFPEFPQATYHCTLQTWLGMVRKWRKGKQMEYGEVRSGWSFTVWWSCTIYAVIQNSSRFTVHSTGWNNLANVSKRSLWMSNLRL